MRRRLSSRARWMLGATLAGLSLFVPGTIALVQLSVEQHRLDRHLVELAAEETRLTRERERLEQDDAYVEGLIRSTFKLAQPGEYVIPLRGSGSKRESR